MAQHLQQREDEAPSGSVGSSASSSLSIVLFVLEVFGPEQEVRVHPWSSKAWREFGGCIAEELAFGVVTPSVFYDLGRSDGGAPVMASWTKTGSVGLRVLTFRFHVDRGTRHSMLDKPLSSRAPTGQRHAPTGRAPSGKGAKHSGTRPTLAETRLQTCWNVKHK